MYSSNLMVTQDNVIVPKCHLMSRHTSRLVSFYLYLSGIVSPGMDNGPDEAPQQGYVQQGSGPQGGPLHCIMLVKV